MASQLVATSGNKRLRRNQIAELEAKMGSLKNIQSNKLKREMHEDTMALKEREFQQNKKMQKKSLAFQEEASRREMGVSALKFGANVAMSGNHSTIGEIGANIKGGLQNLGLMKGGGAVASASSGGAISTGSLRHSPRKASGFGTGQTATPTATGGSFFGNIQPGNILGSGLAGFGASRLVKGKGKRMLLGAGVSGLMSLFGGGSLGTVGGSALFGGLSGLLG